MLTSFLRLALRVIISSVGRNSALTSMFSPSFVVAYIFTNARWFRVKSESRKSIRAKKSKLFSWGGNLIGGGGSKTPLWFFASNSKNTKIYNWKQASISNEGKHDLQRLPFAKEALLMVIDTSLMTKNDPSSDWKSCSLDLHEVRIIPEVKQNSKLNND